MKQIKVKQIFVNDEMFLADNGRLYRYQIQNGNVEVYEKASPSKIITEKIFSKDDSRQESRFWLIKKKFRTVNFKKPDGTLESIYSRWGERGGIHVPLVFGDILFTVEDITWVDTNPYNENTEATYKAYRAKMDQSGYEDITLSITKSPEYRIMGLCTGRTPDKIIAYLKHSSNPASDNKPADTHTTVSWYCESKLENKEYIEWQQVKNVSKNSIKALLKAQ